uniref:DOD-type homing endonuclease domain-containing protein n=1 Tax=viral metagenome TaxID=1070528 RepID=A0A6C0D461_9ZZZZ
MSSIRETKKSSTKNVSKNNKKVYNTRNRLRKNKGDSDSDNESEIFEEDDDSDSSYHPPKRSKKNKRIVIEESEDDEDEWTDDDDEDDEDEDGEDDDDEHDEDEDDDDEEDEEDEEDIGRSALQSIISKIFPSKYMKNRLENTIKEEKENKDKNKKKKSVEKKNKNKKVMKKSKHSKKPRYESDESDEDEDEDVEESDESDEDEDEEDGVFNIVFMGGGEEVEDEEFIEDEEGVECDSDDEQVFMKETYEKVELPEVETTPTKKEKRIEKKSSKSDKKKEEESEELPDVEKEYLELVDTKKQLSQQYTKKPNSKILKKAIKECDDSIKKLVKKARIKNAKTYHKLIHGGNKQANEIDYFKKQLSNKEQLRIMKDLKEINSHINVIKPYRLTLLDSKMPAKFKATALQKLNVLKSMDPCDNEYYKIKNWVDTFMRVPFGMYKSLSVTMADGVETCHNFMDNAMQTLDTCVFGLNDAKMQIMQMIGQWISNPSAMGTAVAIHGPPGTGKCHGFNTPILMYDGSIKMVQDIIVDDLVMGDDSTPRRVLSLGQGEDEMFDVISNNNTSYSVNSEHILCLKPSGMNRIKPVHNKNGTISYKTLFFHLETYKYQYKSFDNKDDAENYLHNLVANQSKQIVEITVKEFLKLPEYIQKHLKGYSTGVEFDTKPILFDPYIIGVWLGDGISSKPQITSQDSSILSYLRNELKKDRLNLNYVSKYDYLIASDEPNRPHPGISKKTGLPYENKNIFTKTLIHYDLLNNKHIPFDYLTNNRQIRLQMLAGIIDTDGWFDIDNRSYEITQKSKRLSDDILFLARSLGFAASQNECDKYCVYKGEKQYGIYYRVNIYGENLHDIPTKCPRKQAVAKARATNALVSGITVVPKGRGTYYGFELDNNHRYVLGNFVVTHNTSLIKDGISKILGREFAFIALGGAGDSSFLEGHSYTYEGSSWGKIVQILIDSKCMNPVIYFDELDKISDTPRGEEIVGILTHLTDTSQNSQFHDKYFSEVDFDLSKCLFIFSYNDESKVNPILKDRMYRIQTKGYESKEKVTIARNYLLPKIREQVNFAEEDVIIPDETIQYITTNTQLTKGESGVRNLKRCLEIIYTKLNLFRLMKPGSTLFGKELDFQVEFPFTVTKKYVDIFIKNEEHQNQSMLAMYV